MTPKIDRQTHRTTSENQPATIRHDRPARIINRIVSFENKKNFNHWKDMHGGKLMSCYTKHPHESLQKKN